MALTAGTLLGPYEILAPIGAGGMGEVYKARDKRLDRDVAVKVLPPQKAASAERKQRFAQEAKSASSLNHPNIITIHDIGSENGIDFIVMEYLPGKSLDHLIPRHGLRLNEVLKYAVQIADALARAHAAGIIHRDLKPGNIMVGEGGQVKVLDFGLAKLTEASESSEGEATRTLRPRTEEGVIVGTASYMSPEQAEGKPVDARSDIFSFGAVLYEMVTGQRAFHGESNMSTLAAILNKDPKSASETTPAVPRDLEKIISRCLRKDPERRFQNMADVKVALVELKEESESGALGAPAATERKNRKRFLWASAVVVLAVAAIGSAWFFRKTAPPPEAAMTSTPLTTYTGSESMPAFSPDGNQVAFVWDGEKEDNTDIYVKLIGGGPPLRLTTDPAPDSGPAWSPDGRSIAFLRERGDKAELLVVPALGGPERKLAEIRRGSALDWSSPYVAWSPDGQWIAFPDAGSPDEPYGLFALAMKTGEKTRLTSPPKVSIGDSSVAFSPDGRELVFARAMGSFAVHLYVLALSQDLRPASEPRLLPSRHPANLTPAWTADGREIIFSAWDLALNPKGLWRIAVSGDQEPRQLASVGDNSDEPAISRQGRRLAYRAGARDTNIWRLEMSGHRGAGSPVKLISSTQYEGNPQYSPDGKKVVFASARSGSTEIWICDADGSNVVQVTSFGAHSGTPRWSPDGRRIVFDCNKEGRFQIYVIDTGGGLPRRLTDNPVDDAAPSFSRDGKQIYFSSMRTGRWEVWKMPAEGGEPVQVTRRGGFSPFESADRRVLYYQKTQGLSDIWKVPVDGGEETKVVESAGHRQFAVLAQGIDFIRMASPGPSLQFLDFATGTTREMAKIGGPTDMGLTVSPDGRYILYTQYDQAGSDLMLVENFR